LVKNGNQETYIERESELEEIFLLDKLDRLALTDGAGKSHTLTAARWQRFNRRLKEHEGWSDSLQAEFGHDPIRFLMESGILDEGVATLAGVKKLLAGKGSDADVFDTEVLAETDTGLRVRAVHRGDGLARTLELSDDLFRSSDYRHLVESHAELLKQVGPPTFEVALDEKARRAESFEKLRGAVLELARGGLKPQRFKGLGEMNADQLRETTMDPASRMLERVRVDDAALAERIFTDLMGDKVEPRKDFIERHAKEVKFLDV
jgi:DNA gyrase subunit B